MELLEDIKAIIPEKLDTDKDASEKNEEDEDAQKKKEYVYD